MVKPLIDNMPEKITAHAVRRLRVCLHCEGFGAREQMIGQGSDHLHTKCYIDRFGFKAAIGLPAAQRDKFRLCDVSMTQMKKLIAMRVQE